MLFKTFSHVQNFTLLKLKYVSQPDNVLAFERPRKRKPHVQYVSNLLMERLLTKNFKHYKFTIGNANYLQQPCFRFLKGF